MNFISENPSLNIVSVTSVPWKSYVFYFLQMQESLNPLSGRHRKWNHNAFLLSGFTQIYLDN